ncbi:hypothetical protein V5799_026259 [Amblyomma americanum]|uniref:Phosphagen kinase N-terminal domain-containing protein n=1 Tax=Amblyomma americanum TaxID=6943 RepID=A0AAQ4DJ34_AMBAM
MSASRQAHSQQPPLLDLLSKKRVTSDTKQEAKAAKEKESKSDKMVDQATLDKLEAGFKKLQDAKDCKSLLKKYLTKEVFDKLKTRKTAMGATLLDVIQSGEPSVLSFPRRSY